MKVHYLLLKRKSHLESTSSLQDAPKEDVVIAQQIAHEFDGLPLALSQAGAYIEGSQLSFGRYLELWR